MHPILITAGILTALGQPVLQDELFELPPGFHIYKAAPPELTDGSYDIATDADGRLLVGDGKNIRRLVDVDADGVFDSSETIATGLGPRGPQGLLVVGDRVYAVGGDGLQVFSGYLSGGALKHEGRLGEPFNTGGDHSAHMIFRGHDDYLYFITGDGGGTKDRVHITEEHSPVLFERKCSVFRISPDGKRWECVGSGGRNSPNVGMNYLGDLFSLDSDMEWHVEMPWWRPVRLHHWIAGGDQGWQGVGAYPPYYVDNLPGIVDVGRGSPCWGQFYEHVQFPEAYRNSYLVCDYPWKSATTGQYATGGQIYSFSLERHGASWKTQKSVLVRPRPGVNDAEGNAVLFGVVDLEVAPDGSLFVSERGQGVWRIVYAPEGNIAPVGPPEHGSTSSPLADLLTLLQPQSEWSRVRAAQLRAQGGPGLRNRLEEYALSGTVPLPSRLRAVRLLTREFQTLTPGFLSKLAHAESWELRSQAAWLIGLRGVPELGPLAVKLLDDRDPFVRRRACEALMRLGTVEAGPALIRRLEDDDRHVRYAAMIALTHREPESWYPDAVAAVGLQTRVRALVARHLARRPPAREELMASVQQLLRDASSRAARGTLPAEHHLDVLRVVGIYRDSLVDEPIVRDQVALFLRRHFPSPHPDLYREGARLLGDYRLPSAFRPLLASLKKETDPVLQFHIAQSLAKVPAGWSAAEETQATDWFLNTQRGWFADFKGKGRQFPEFWRTVLTDFCRWHGDTIASRLDEVALDGLLAGPALEAASRRPGGHHRLAELYQQNPDPTARRAIVHSGLGQAPGAEFGGFLRQAYREAVAPALRGALLLSLSGRTQRDEADLPLLEEGLLHDDRRVVQACAGALRVHKLKLEEARLATVVGLLERREPLLHTYETLLVAWTDTRRPDYDPTLVDSRRNRPTPDARQAVVSFWQDWYAERFGHPATGGVALESERSDEDLHSFLARADWSNGSPGRGLKVYEAARCATCHGGGSAGDKLFGPDLAGITQRLSRQEFIESLVYPSKRVEDRFKGVVAQTQGGLPIAGFLTAEDTDSVTVATQEKVHRIARKDLLFIAPQETSLMPERLLNRLPNGNLVDLMAFLSAPRKKGGTDDER